MTEVIDCLSLTGKVQAPHSFRDPELTSPHKYVLCNGLYRAAFFFHTFSTREDQAPRAEVTLRKVL